MKKARVAGLLDVDISTNCVDASRRNKINYSRRSCERPPQDAQWHKLRDMYVVHSSARILSAPRKNTGLVVSVWARVP